MVAPVPGSEYGAPSVQIVDHTQAMQQHCQPLQQPQSSQQQAYDPYGYPTYAQQQNQYINKSNYYHQGQYNQQNDSMAQ